MNKYLDLNGLIYFWSKLKAKLHAVAFSGSYNDLQDKPNIPSSIEAIPISTIEALS